MTLVVEQVCAGYGRAKIVRDVSLSVAKGSVVALVGPNGAGKTTLLRAIAGQIHPSAGLVTVDGVQISGRPTYRIARRGVLLVPEGRQILGQLSVLDNLILGRLAGQGRNDGFECAVSDVYELFPRLHERRTQLAGSLSGGEQQMLAIGRALMGRPHVILLDEPSLGLAPVIVDQVFSALGRLAKAGIALLIVEQRAKRALELASHGYVMERGQIVLQGSAQELLDDPNMATVYFGGNVT
jgi:branched-chain amino acid transport system ATP-binding protein